MEHFKNQISEDIKLLQDEWKHLDPKINDDSYAFNYWVLNKLFSIDEEIIDSLITENSDKGIDCYVHFEESKELFIIQNKHYSLETNLDRKLVADFLQTPISILDSNNYKRSNPLQTIFNKVKKDSSYKIWLHFYITNNITQKSDDINILFNKFKYESENIKAYIGAELFDLKKINDIYYGKRYKDSKNFNYTLNTRNKATSLNILPEEYNLPKMLKSHYIMTPVFELFDLYRKAEKEDYPLFEENIREYLGSKGINKKIIDTLKDKEKRNKFFYFNNGITIICRDTGKKPNNNSFSIQLLNPQIVNGCQTMNSIREALNSFGRDEEIKKEFEDTYVITKVLVFKENDAQDKEFYKDIVKYTNTQNSLNEKAFASNLDYFNSFKNDFYQRGFLLTVKPSDENKFKDEFKDKIAFSKFKEKSKNLMNFFDLPTEKISDYMIPLDKLLQVLLAFIKDGYFAYTKKDAVLKRSSKIYIDYSLRFHENLTFDNMLNLFLLYKKSEIDKKNSEDKKSPISYYLICFVGYKINKENPKEIKSKLDYLFSNKSLFDKVYSFTKKITQEYRSKYYKLKKIEYNEMIKKELDYNIIDDILNSGLQFTEDIDVKEYFK